MQTKGVKRKIRTVWLVDLNALSGPTPVAVPERTWQDAFKKHRPFVTDCGNTTYNKGLLHPNKKAAILELLAEILERRRNLKDIIDDAVGEMKVLTQKEAALLKQWNEKKEKADKVGADLKGAQKELRKNKEGTEHRFMREVRRARLAY